MRDEHYPNLFRRADAASRAAQKTYIFLQRMYLVSLVASSGVGVISGFGITALNAWLYSVVAIILTLGLLVLWVMRSRQDEKVWFDCRAIAESVKTATWRFMMSAPPFQNDGSVDKRLVAELREIRQARPDSGKHLAGVVDPDAAAITDFMWQIRSHSFNRRKSFYIEHRICDQKSWYSRKSMTNAQSGARWFWTTVGLQAVAIVFAIIQVKTGGFGANVNFVSIITTCAAAIAAWNQVKRHDELAQSYALAAQELSEIESIAGGMTSENDFPQLVEQAEEAISREHTMWCARRDTLLSRHADGRTR